ncbi:MAG: CDP-diacylglycerol--serine O-phosphatidyltransferase [Petrimonas sp.]|nr:CDP-diacylglycerol--serine O-phosphatidyltransferase [Petrimonas sp.]
MKKHIPNTITMMNLFSGCIAIVMAFHGNFFGVVFWVLMAAVFDFFDGLAARLLGVSSKMGVELDSLADVVSFGVAPATAVFMFLFQFTYYPAFLLPLKPYIPYLAFLIPVFSALRLAKFNIDERQTSSFLGLPTPANALFWISYVYGAHIVAGVNGYYLYLTIAFIVGLSLLMVSEVPMFSLKFKKLQWRGHEKQIILVILMIIFTVVWGIKGIAWGILAYIVVSVVSNQIRKTVK